MARCDAAGSARVGHRRILRDPETIAAVVRSLAGTAARAKPVPHS